MTNSSRAEENCIEETAVGFVAVTETLPCMEEKGDVDSFPLAFFLEEKHAKGEIMEDPAEIFWSHEAIAFEKLWILLLGFDTQFHIRPKCISPRRC